MKSLRLAAVIFCCAIANAQTSSTISGVVRDYMGAAIANADVAVHWNLRLPGGPPAPKSTDVTVKTDRLGRYSMTVVPGFYDVCVLAPVFTPRCTTLKAQEAKIAAYNPRMEANPLINFPNYRTGHP